ncbi:hypothetical protein FPV67DRAFT_63831 [Lyophyllum atratum]|nr:hypothetical protein FPV67DRAFT_63831 [Lyophyllum atratum]
MLGLPSMTCLPNLHFRYGSRGNRFGYIYTRRRYSISLLKPLLDGRSFPAARIASPRRFAGLGIVTPYSTSMSRTHSLHMFPRNVLAEPKYVPPVDDSPSRSLASPPLSPLPTQTMICTISSLRININPNNTPQSLKSLEKIPDIHPGAGSRLMGIREEGKIHTSFALSSALNSTPNTLLSAPTPLWNPSTSQIRPILTLASAQATEVANKPIFCIFCNVRPLIQYLIELLSFGALHDAPRREPLLATAPLFGFPITVPPSSWITVYPDPPSSASTSQPSSTRSRRESASLPSISKSSVITSASTSISSNIPSTYTDSSSPSSSLTLPPNSSSSTSLSTILSSLSYPVALFPHRNYHQVHHEQLSQVVLC